MTLVAFILKLSTFNFRLVPKGEETKDILIKESKVVDNSATVVVELLSEKGNSKGYQTLTVTLDKEGAAWKINDIANGK